MKEEGDTKTFSGPASRGAYQTLPCERPWVWQEAGGAGGARPHAIPSPFARAGRRQQAPALCLRPPRCSQSTSSCSGHSLLMIEMLDWAKFPTGMLRDSILSKALATAHRRSAFTYSSLQWFAFPFLGLLQRTTKERVFIRVTECRCASIASQRRVALALCTAWFNSAMWRN